MRLKKIVEKNILMTLQDAFLKYTDSSAAIFEINGGYAACRINSEYCRFLNQASQKASGETKKEAFASGCWICHEDCQGISRTAMDEKKACETLCSGGIKIFGAPIIVGDNVVGCVTGGISNPPINKSSVKKIAQHYCVDPKELLRIAQKSPRTPDAVFNAAKNHIVTTAGIIAELFSQKQTYRREIFFKKSKWKLMENAIQALQHPFYIIDVNNFRIQMANEATYVNAPFGATTCYRVTHGRDEPCIGEHPCPIQEIKKSKKPVILEHIHYDKNGAPMLVEVRAHPIFDENGELIQIVEYSVDITERKRLEEELKQSTMEMALVLSEVFLTLNKLTAGDPSVRINLESEDELITKLVEMVNLTAEFIDELVAEANEFAIGLAEQFNVMTKVAAGDYAIRVSNDSGLEIMRSLASVTNQTINAISSNHATLHEYTKELEKSQKIALSMMEDANFSRQEAEQAHNNIKLILEKAQFGVVIIAKDRKIRWVNDVVLQLAGVDSREELVGKYCSEYLCSTEIGECPILDKQQQIDNNERVLHRKDGTEIPILKTVTEITFENEEVLLETFIDISEQKEAEENKKRAQELEKALEIRNEFISVVSHELRTPLSISKQALSLLLRGKLGDIPQNQKDIMLMASSNLDRLSVLINNILDFSKIDAGKMTLNKEESNIIESIRDCCDGWQLEAGNKKINLKINIPETKIDFFFDKSRVSEILSNLINNALKFTPEEGSVEIFLKDFATHVEIAVKDSGCGIAQKDISKLFQKFTQVGRTSGPGAKGTGLGLAIVKSLVEMHGGRIWVESEIDKGTVFLFTLPKLTEQDIDNE